MVLFRVIYGIEGSFFKYVNRLALLLEQWVYLREDCKNRFILIMAIICIFTIFIKSRALVPYISFSSEKNGFIRVALFYVQKMSLL